MPVFGGRVEKPVWNVAKAVVWNETMLEPGRDYLILILGSIAKMRK